MKKLVKILVFVLALFLMGCGEKKEELTGLHKEFDIIFNGIKEEATSEFNASKKEMEKIAKNSTGSEKEAEAMFNSFETVLEALKIATYSVENINDMGNKAELKIKVKAVDFVALSDELLKNYKIVSVKNFYFYWYYFLIERYNISKYRFSSRQIWNKQFLELDKIFKGN